MAQYSGKRRGLRTKGSLVRDLAGMPFVMASSKSHLLMLRKSCRTTDLNRLRRGFRLRSSTLCLIVASVLQCSKWHLDED